MPEHIIAAFLGAALSASRRVKKGFADVVRTLLTGFVVAYFTAPSTAISLSTHYDIVVSHGAAAVVIAYWGPWLVDEIIYKIRAIKAVAKW